MAGFDWSAKHTPVSGSINAATGLMALSSAASLAHIQPGWPMLAAGVGAFGGVIGGLAREDNEKLHRHALLYRSACWMGAGAWTSFALAQPDGPLSVMTLATLATGATFFGSMNAALANRRRRKREAQAAAAAYLTKLREANEWEDRFDRVCSVKGCKVINLEKWPKGAGFTLEVELPPGGTTWQAIQGFSPNLAADARLPEGCGVEISPGVNRGVFLCKVSKVNMLHKVHDLPDDFSELDYEKHFDIGIERDGNQARVNMREFSGTLVGQKRSGKTNELHTCISRFMRMPNLAVWVIDFNGGGLALPWMRAWEEAGRPGRRPIDWVAATEDEALRMVKAAVRIAKRRKLAYQNLMYKANTDLLPMTAQIPGIMIILDEGAEILGVQNAVGASGQIRREIAKHYVEILRIAGSVGINELTCGLRATADVFGDPMVKKQSRVKIGMMMDDQDEIAYLLGWQAKITPEDMPRQGYGAYQDGVSGVTRVFKGYRTLPTHIAKVVQATCDRRPELDPVSAEEGGTDYAERWDRADWLNELRSSSRSEDGATASAEGGQAVLLEKRTEEEQQEPDPIAQAFDTSVPTDSEAVWQRAREAIREAGGPDLNDREKFEAIMKANGMVDWEDPAAWPDSLPVPEVSAAEEDTDAPVGDGDEFEDLKATVFGMVKATGENGIMPSEVVKSLQTYFPSRKLPALKTITRWLKRDDRIYQPRFGYYAVKPNKENK